MDIASARYLDPDHTLVEAVIDGVVTQEVGGGTENFVIRSWIAAGNVPADYVAPVIVQTVFDGAVFLQRVSDAEYVAITGSSNVQVRRWIEIFRLRGQIDVTGETAQAAKAGLVALGLLTQQRADVIFATA